MKSLVYKLLFLSVFIMGFTSCDDRNLTCLVNGTLLMR